MEVFVVQRWDGDGEGYYVVEVTSCPEDVKEYEHHPDFLVTVWEV